MIIIDGVRVRPEDAERYGGGTRGQMPSAPQTPTTPPAPAAPFDPASAGVPEVLEYLSGVGLAEATRVLDAEAAGKNRVGLTSKREQLLAAAREHDGASGGTAT